MQVNRKKTTLNILNMVNTVIISNVYFVTKEVHIRNYGLVKNCCSNEITKRICMEFCTTKQNVPSKGFDIKIQAWFMNVEFQENPEF